MKSFIITLLCIIILSTKVYCQHDHSDHEAHIHTDNCGKHKHHLGIAAGPVYLFGEKEIATAAHIHYAYLFSIKDLNFASGLGFESIFDEHKHYVATINFTYMPVHSLSLTLSPGLQFGEEGYKFSSHYEISYEFIIGKLHIGPVVEFAHAEDDMHLTFGAHIGIGF